MEKKFVVRVKAVEVVEDQGESAALIEHVRAQTSALVNAESIEDAIAKVNADLDTHGSIIKQRLLGKDWDFLHNDIGFDVEAEELDETIHRIVFDSTLDEDFGMKEKFVVIVAIYSMENVRGKVDFQVYGKATKVLIEATCAEDAERRVLADLRKGCYKSIILDYMYVRSNLECDEDTYKKYRYGIVTEPLDKNLDSFSKKHLFLKHMIFDMHEEAVIDYESDPNPWSLAVD